MNKIKARYQPEVFDVGSEKEAKNIILTPENGTTTEERWEKETKYLIEDIGSFFKPRKDMVILDFGCGIGRLSKELIEKYGCFVLGVDISMSMRLLALGYVNYEKFAVMSNLVFKRLVSNGLKVDCCLALWVLQHCPDVENEISLIKFSLKDDGLLYVLNYNLSVIPTNIGWIDSDVDIKKLLENSFHLLNYSKLPKSHTTEQISEKTFIAKLKK